MSTSPLIVTQYGEPLFNKIPETGLTLTVKLISEALTPKTNKYLDFTFGCLFFICSFGMKREALVPVCVDGVDLRNKPILT